MQGGDTPGGDGPRSPSLPSPGSSRFGTIPVHLGSKEIRVKSSFGSAQEKVLGYFVRAFLTRFSHLAILLFFFVGTDDILSWSSLAASLVFAGVVYAFVYREVLPETLPKDLRRQLRRWPGKAERPVKEPD